MTHDQILRLLRAIERIADTLEQVEMSLRGAAS